jgi:hypothetical protein
MERFAFAQSAHIWLRASDEEISRAEQHLQRAKRLQRESRAELDDEVEAALIQAVTDVQVGLTLAADLLEVPPQEAPREAVSLGADVAVAYKSLATGSAANKVSVVVPRLDRPESVVLTPAKASLVKEALREIEEPEEMLVDAYGVLSMADALLHEFALRLDPRGDRPAELRNKRIVRGTYEARVGDAIRDRGLWDRSVRARIRIETDAIVSTSAIRPPTFTLVDVEERPG